MKNQKGVTLATLSIYVIVTTVLLGTLAFINVNIMSELSELTKRSRLINEMTKVYSFFIEDVKSADSVLEFSEDTIRFDSGVQYKIKYRANSKVEDNQTYDVYEVYRGDVLVTDKLSGVFFDYNDDGYIKVRLYGIEDDIIEEEEQYFKVGRGY